MQDCGGIMKKTAIATDTNSGLTEEQAQELGIFLLPMSFNVNGKDYVEGRDIYYKDFYKLLSDSKTTVSTTQPSPVELTSFWDDILKEYDEIVYIPMSSGLSSSCQTAKMLAASDYEGKVFVADNHRISVTQSQSAVDAKAMADAGKGGEEICGILEADGYDASIYIMVNKLTYLKRGGRVTAAGALIANVMNLKPVLQIQGEKLDAYAKSRGTKTAKKTMIEAMKKDLESRFADCVDKGQMVLYAVYSDMKLFEVESWISNVKEAFPGFEIQSAPLSLSIGCHIGPGSLAIACVKRSE